MASRYFYKKAEGQDDKNACWAACLVWWLKATNKAHYEQWELMGSDEYSDLWNTANSGGTISEAGILTIVQDTRWRMAHQKLDSAPQLTAEILRGFLSNGPVYIGYKDLISNGNHVNIIYDIFGNESYPQVSVMEPGFKKKSNGKFKGKHITRGLSYYRTSGVVILASPADPISLDR